jgi:catechol-2,3-dioxygenase
MEAFYARGLGLRLIARSGSRISFAAGRSTLTFACGEDGHPFYHFAFNIPENKIAAARTWQLERSPLLPIPPDLRDPAYPIEVVDYRHWNAHSIFFFDPARNVVEYIARHDLKNAAPGPFGPADILYASEIGFIVDDVAAASSVVREGAGVEQYRSGSDQFMALGDEQGLLLVMRRGRPLDFRRENTARAAAVYPTRAVVRGLQRPISLPGFPYEIVAG